MKKEEIIEKCMAFFTEEFEVDGSKISGDANLRETLDLDSLDYVDLVVVIESNFGFKVKGEDFINIHTFDDFYNYCYNKIQEKTKETVQ
jgi:acyl carrier protein